MTEPPDAAFQGMSTQSAEYAVGGAATIEVNVKDHEGSDVKFDDPRGSPDVRHIG